MSEKRQSTAETAGTAKTTGTAKTAGTAKTTKTTETAKTSGFCLSGPSGLRGLSSPSPQPTPKHRQWPKVRLGEVCELVSYRGHQIKQSEIRPSGKYPVVSQSEELIEGYSNSEIAIEDLPLVLFGDHTCCVKLIDFPFVVGADGTKLLKSKEAEAQYLAFALRFLQPTIADGKYRRHFGDLMEREIPLPPLADQRQIAARLDRICEIVTKRKAQLAQLQQLVKSRFVEMFGDPMTNPLEWPMARLGDKCTITTGNTPPRADAKNYGDFIEWIKSDNIVDGQLTRAVERLSEEGFEKSRYVGPGAILMTCIAGSLNSIGNCTMVDRQVAFNQQLNAITPGEEYNGVFLLWLLRLSKNVLHKGINKCLKGILSKGNLSGKELPLPPLALQHEFAAFVAKVDRLEVAVKRGLAAAERLYRQQLQEVFGEGVAETTKTTETTATAKTTETAETTTTAEIAKTSGFCLSGPSGLRGLSSPASHPHPNKGGFADD